MSAYDNPTIIKDDSAMIYAQMLGTAGQTFTESFKAARKEREAKEKEERLEAEKKEKESKEVQLNKQVYASNTIKQQNAEIEKTRNDLSKVGAPPPITDQAVKFELEFKNIFGENAQKIKFDEVTNDFIEADAKLQSEFNNTDANLKRIIGEGGSQVKEGADMALNQTNASARYFRGRTNAQKLRELVTFNGLVLNKDITPDLVYDKKNFKGATLDIKTTGYDENKLKTAMGTIDPNVIANDENWQTFIKEATKEGILEETTSTDNKKNYTIIYNKPIDSKTKGDFFVTAPTAMKEKDLETAGIYSDKGVLYDSFLGDVTYNDVKGNAGLKKSEFDIKVKSRVVDMGAMMDLVEKKVNSNINGMISVDFTDLDKLMAFITDVGLGTDLKTVDKFSEMTLTEQINFLSKPIIKKYEEQIMKDNNIVKTKDKSNKEIYVQVDRADVEKFSVPDKTLEGGSAIDPDLEAIKEQMLKAEPRKYADYPSYKGRKVSWDGKMFTITTEGSKGKDKPFNSVEDAIAYMAGLPTKK